MMAILGQSLLYIIILCGVFGLLCYYHNTVQHCCDIKISEGCEGGADTSGSAL